MTEDSPEHHDKMNEPPLFVHYKLSPSRVQFIFNPLNRFLATALLIGIGIGCIAAVVLRVFLNPTSVLEWILAVVVTLLAVRFLLVPKRAFALYSKDEIVDQVEFRGGSVAYGSGHLNWISESNKLRVTPGLFQTSILRDSTGNVTIVIPSQAASIETVRRLLNNQPSEK